MSGRNTSPVRLNGSRTMNVVVLDKGKITERLCAAVSPPSDALVETAE